MKNKNKGFTLIELLIVIAIIGILASVGYPAYTSMVKKGNRADGIDSLVSLAGRMEEVYMVEDSYVNAAVASVNSSDGLYTIAINSADAYSRLIVGKFLTNPKFFRQLKTDVFSCLFIGDDGGIEQLF
jgi:prepilin-type N-terminal cleavage/methylation domain-containing protein